MSFLFNYARFHGVVFLSWEFQNELGKLPKGGDEGWRRYRFVTSTTTDSSPTGYRPGALSCDVVAMKPAYEGFEVASGRGVCYGESSGGSPVVGGSVEVVDGGNWTAIARSVGKGSVGVDETVSSATTTSGKRLGKTLSSSKISLKNMGKKGCSFFVDG
ncbi:hypothetical protein ACSQ67_006144 [Phaseolus vulgaris]